MSLPKAVFEEISSFVNQTLQSNPAKDLEKNVKSLVTALIEKMDIVTQEKFELQEARLQKNYRKIMELEKKIADLECILNKQNHKDKIQSTTLPVVTSETSPVQSQKNLPSTKSRSLKKNNSKLASSERKNKTPSSTSLKTPGLTND